MKKEQRIDKKQIEAYIKLLKKVMPELEKDLVPARTDVKDFLANVIKEGTFDEFAGTAESDIMMDSGTTFTKDNLTGNLKSLRTVKFKNRISKVVEEELTGETVDSPAKKRVVSTVNKPVEIERYEEYNSKGKDGQITEFLVRKRGTATNRVEFYMPEEKVLYQTGKEAGKLYSFDKKGKIVVIEISEDVDIFRDREILNPRKEKVEKENKAVRNAIIGGLAGGILVAGLVGYIVGKNGNDQDNNLNPTTPPTSESTSPEDTSDKDNVVTPPVENEDEAIKEVEPFNIQNYLENEKKVVDIITEVTSQEEEITSVFFKDEKLDDTYVLRTFADGSYDLLAQEGNSGYQVIYEGSEGVVKNTIFDKNGMTIQMDVFMMNFNTKTGEQTITDPLGNVLTYDEVTIAGIPFGAIEEFVMDNPEEFAEYVG